MANWCWPLQTHCKYTRKCNWFWKHDRKCKNPIEGVGESVKDPYGKETDDGWMMGGRRLKSRRLKSRRLKSRRSYK
jgi:hypothetical protein